MRFLGISLGGVLTIFAAGAALNVAGRGTLGTHAQKASKFITEGFGV